MPSPNAPRRENAWPAARRFCLIAAIAVGLASGAARAQVDDPNVCTGHGETPDVIVGEISNVLRWGNVGGITAFSFATWSCNIGTCQLEWIHDTNRHPVIGQNLFRLRDERFEQVGQSWLKHGFFALSLTLCDNDCLPTDGRYLGVHCADPYSANLNGDQDGLGPKFEVNAATGEFPYPPTDIALTGDAIFKRLQVHDSDLEPLFNPGSLYFVEATYVTPDDAAAQNNTNNASYRQVAVSKSDGALNLSLIGQTQRERSSILAWRQQDPAVVLDTVDVPDDGRFILGSKATEVVPGLWQYEYAVQNVMSHRAAGSFSVPVPAGAQVAAIAFHDVDYHSGEPFDGSDWAAEVVQDALGRRIVWSTTPFGQNPNANALRWGTLYNFRFRSDAGPGEMPGSVRLGLYRPGSPGEVSAALLVPAPCDLDGICGATESCSTCADCVGPSPDDACCGDEICDPSEDPCACAADCGPCIVACGTPAECDDGLFCNGSETCVEGFCAPGGPPCPDLSCDDGTDACLECLFQEDCDNGVWCDGAEWCVGGDCVPGADPCPGQLCDEAGAICVNCLSSADCDDDLFCNGDEACDDGECAAGAAPCAPGDVCDEALDACFTCTRTRPCDDGQFCNGEESCAGDSCLAGVPACAGAICDELHDTCLAADAIQPLPGDPLPGLDDVSSQRFEAGRIAFAQAFDAVGGLGPVYNATSCSACHVAAGGAGTATVSRFGLDDAGTFDPLTSSGGSLHQELAVSPECAETIPAAANVVGARLPAATHGGGLVEAIPDDAIEARALNPPPGLLGRVHRVPLLEDVATLRVGRFGWKATQASLLSLSAEEALDALGLTSRLLTVEHAPGGDAGLLAACDETADPETTGEPGSAFIDHVADYLRFLAQPPQTPKSGMSGEVQFFAMGCADCHAPLFRTSDDPAVEAALRDRPLKPYSDFLLHDMGAAGDPIAQGEAGSGDVRTAPLWGLAARSRQWHDGRFAGGEFGQRARAAIAAHGAAGSEAAPAAQAFAAASANVQSRLVTFLASLGRVEFDADTDGDVDGADYTAFKACHLGPGTTYGQDHPCRVHDGDADGDVDDHDYARFLAAFEGRFGGDVAGLIVERAPTGELALSWGSSCRAEDTDYAVYQGTLGNFTSHFGRRCSTLGATSTTLAAPSGSVYFLVVPTNGLSEGSYGADSDGVERPAAAGGLACLPQLRADDCVGL